MSGSSGIESVPHCLWSKAHGVGWPGPITAARTHVEFFRLIPHQLHLDGAPAMVGIGLRVVGKGIQVGYIATDGSEGLLLVFPAFSEKSLSAGGGAHALEDGSR